MLSHSESVMDRKRSPGHRSTRPAPFSGGESATEDLDPLSLLRGELVDRFVSEGWTPLHAASADVDGRLVVLPGASGSGKSTLALMLALRGHAVADELVLLREAAPSGGGEAPPGLQGRGSYLPAAEPRGVEAMVPALPLSVTEETLCLLPSAGAWRLGPTRRTGTAEGKVLVRPPCRLRSAGRVDALVMLDGSRDGTEPSLVPATRSEAARLLLENTARFTGGGAEYSASRRRVWGTFCALLDGVPSFVLRGDPFQAGHGAARSGPRSCPDGAARSGPQCCPDGAARSGPQRCQDDAAGTVAELLQLVTTGGSRHG